MKPILTAAEVRKRIEARRVSYDQNVDHPGLYTPFVVLRQVPSRYRTAYDKLNEAQWYLSHDLVQEAIDALKESDRVFRNE